MGVITVIPARYASSRFPGKMLVNETGKPLIVHVCERAAESKRSERLVVATDDTRIAQAVVDAGFEAVLTHEDHENGTSRIAEALTRLDADDADIVVNVQGDEPEIDPGVIDLAVDTLMQDESADVATIASPIADPEEANNPNVVKVVADRHDQAMYFSRAPIPFDRDGTRTAPLLRHVGLYVYRRAFLERYATLKPTPLETAERLEQLRILEYGHTIALAVTETGHAGIDTVEQYQAFKKRLAAEEGAAA